LESWTTVHCEGKLPIPRSGCKSAVKGSLIYFFGGYTTKSHGQKDLFNDLNCFDTTNNTWSDVPCLLPNQAPPKRTDHSLVHYNDFLYAFGGKGVKAGKEEVFRDFYKFNLKTRTWIEIKGERAVLDVRFGHCANVYKDSMYTFGGWNGKNCLDDFYQYSFQTNIWYNLKNTSGEKPCARYRHDSLVYKDSLYVFGGVNETQNRFNDFYRYHFIKREWSSLKVSGCTPSPRTFHKIVNFDNLLFLLGGTDGERKNDMYIIRLSDDENVPTIRHASKNLCDPCLLDDLDEIDEKLKYGESPQKLIQMFNEQVLELSQKLQKEEERHLCKICFTREIDALFLECCHFMSCYICSGSLKKCPVCREEITKVVRTYTS